MEFYTNSELSHHGILGMKWGVRRYQNPDGTLTEAGEKRYQVMKDLEKKAKVEAERNESDYLKSPEGKAYQKWRKQNPDADLDDFGDWLVDHPEIPEYEGDRSIYDNKYYFELQQLGDNYVKDQAIISSVVSALTLTPMVGLATLGITKNGKAALATSGILQAGITLASVRSAVKDKHETEKKYGLR